jgi:hypothetical protein
MRPLETTIEAPASGTSHKAIHITPNWFDQGIHTSGSQLYVIVKQQHKRFRHTTDDIVE